MEKKNQRYKKCCTKEKRNANRKVLPAPAFPSTSRCGVWPGVEARPCQSSLNLNFNFKCHNFPSIYSTSAASVAHWHSGMKSKLIKC